MKPNLLIRASAGSGKTRQLSFRYLELIARGVPIPTILASTFTNKATGEILNRIILTAAQACRDDALRDELARNAEREISSLEMRQILQKLIANLHQIRACSLDSFFNQVAQCFPYELDLKPGWKILDDSEDEHLRWNAIQKTLKENIKNAPTLVRQIFKGEVKKLLADDIFENVKSLLELNRHVNQEAWEAIQAFPKFVKPNEEEITDFLETIAAESDSVASRIVPILAKISSEIQADAWHLLFDQTLIQNAFAADTSEPIKYGSSKIKSDELNRVLRRIAQYAASAQYSLLKEQVGAVHELISSFTRIYDADKKQANGLCFNDVTRFVSEYVRSLDGRIETLFWRMNSSINHLLLDEFQDTSIEQWHIFQPLGKFCAEDENRTFFCVGDVKQAIYHWRNGRSEIFDAIESKFKDIAVESSNMSWRSAPEIIRCVNRFFMDPMKLECKSAGEGSGSEEAFIVPEPIASNAAWQPLSSVLKENALEAWLGWRCEKHITSPRSSCYPGYWELRTMPKKSQNTAASAFDDGLDSNASEADSSALDSSDSSFKWIAERIAEIYRKSGKTHRIGVLFRKNVNMPRIAMLLRELGVPVSEEGKMKLVSSQMVRFILSMLSLIDFPNNSLAWYYVGNSPLAKHFPELAWQPEALRSEPERSSIRERKSACLSKLRMEIQAFGIAEFVKRMLELLQCDSSEEEKRRLQQLLNIAAAYEQKSSLMRISDFVQYVKKATLEDPSGAPVVFMTIHGSKGLQFDIVVLPELDFELKGRSAKILPGYPNDDIFQEPELVTPYPNENARKYLFESYPAYKRAFALGERERIRESLSMLYVALTRAVYAMYIFVPPGNASAAKLSGLLQLVLAGVGKSEPESLLAWDGDPEWYFRTGKFPKGTLIETSEGVDTEKAAKSTQKIIEPITFRSVPESSRNLTWRAPSNIEDRHMVDLGKKLDFCQQNTLNGTILHSWYEKIAWVENSLPSDEELIMVAKPYALSKDRLERLLKGFHNSLKSPRLDRILHWQTYIPMLREKVIQAGILPPEEIPATIFRKTPKDPSEIHWEVYREKELAIRTKEELLLGTLDRLILLRNESEVFWADCIDYKTTRKVSSPEVLEEKIESHRHQMNDYRKMLQLHYRIPENRISTHLVFSMLGVVREV